MKNQHKRKCSNFLEWMYYIKSLHYISAETEWQVNKLTVNGKKYR